MEWTPPQGSFDGYMVSYGVNSVDENSMEVSQEELGATLTGLQAGSSYQVQLQSVRGGVKSQPLQLTLQTGELLHACMHGVVGLHPTKFYGHRTTL